MKKLAKTLLILMTVGLMTMCSDDPGPSNSNDPNDFCTGGLCDDPLIKSQCVKSYEDCQAIGRSTDAECKAIALGVCNL
jgi:hypothetical protein